jgi:starch synthase (maltosyl-transferring)
VNAIGKQPAEARPGISPSSGRSATAGQKPARIYYFNPHLAGPPERWGAHFERAARLGFDTILLAPPFEAGAADNIARVKNHCIMHAALGGGDALACLSNAARLAGEAGLSLMLDLMLDRLALDADLTAAHPDWFSVAGDSAAMRFLGPDDVTVAWWIEMISRFTDAGIQGFRCDEAHYTPPHVWSHILTEARRRSAGTMFIAWAPGAGPEALAGLAGCGAAGRGFDFAASSSCWWNFRAGWLDEDAARITAIAPAMATPEPLFGARAAADPDIERASLASRRALALAAHYAPGFLMPMGFEYGAEAPMPRHSGALAEAFQALQSAPRFDLTREVAAVNARLVRQAKLFQGDAARVVSPPWADVAVLARGSAPNPGQNPGAVLLANASLDAPGLCSPSTILLNAGMGGQLARFDQKQPVSPADIVILPPGETMLCRIMPLPAIKMTKRQTPDEAVAAPRIAIEAVTPSVDGGRFPAKRVVGETVAVEADLLCDGHDKLSADLLWRAEDETEWQRAPMALLNNDRWTASMTLTRMGRYQLSIEAWKDNFASFADEVTKKHEAGVPVTLETEEGIELVRKAAARTAGDAKAALTALLQKTETGDTDARRVELTDPATVALMRAHAERQFSTTLTPPVLIDAERKAASFASWYEIFPRSASDDEQRHGTFGDVIRQLPRIRAMGFDVLYFPPIHPIGRKNRKGRNNSLTPAPDDPGSPYAIGSPEGGHDAINPALGTLEDFLRLKDAALAQGLELALDFAIQCAPDHPWLTQHPEWFDWRPDGSIKYAENPPKKYEDIVNVDFYTAGAKPALWRALRDVVLFWAKQGIRIFRVDNPHTKPFPFWEWMIGDIRGRYPDVMFLAEAFTRPKLMYRLAKIGFSQSYTYFTWRNTKQELTEYLTELSTTAPRDFFRPHFFVNTPDINPVFLQSSGRPGFIIRAALAATLSGLFGVYNGFELCEAAALPGREEYLDSEKYQIKAWDWQRPGNIVKEITQLNQIRRSNPALHSHLGITFLAAGNDNILYFMKSTADRGNVLLVAISLDPINVQQANIDLPLWHFGLPDSAALAAEDLMRGVAFIWYGKQQNVRLDPNELPVCIWRIRKGTQ